MAALRLQEVSLHDLFADESLLAAWRALAGDAPESSYFQTVDWVGAWWETVAGRPEGRVALVWNGEQLRGLFALARTREPLVGRLGVSVPLLTNVGSGIGTDHAGWLSMDEATDHLIAEWVASQRAVILRAVSMEQGEMVGGRLIDTTRCPRLEIDRADELTSKNLAKTLRNATRRLDREGVTFEWKGPGQVTADDLNTLYALHHERRTAAGGSGIFADPARRAFHEYLLRPGHPDSGTAMMTASSETGVRGVLYGFVWRETFSYYQTGWDPELAKLSMGSVLVQQAIDACRDEGLRLFDFLRGPEEYKYRFGATDLVEGTWAIGNSLGLTAFLTGHRIRTFRTRRAASEARGRSTPATS